MNDALQRKLVRLQARTASKTPSIRFCPYSYQIKRRRVKDASGKTMLVDIVPIEINCGKCLQCRQKKVKEWTFRLELEALAHVQKPLFLTLTLKKNEQPNKKKCQAYFKALRRKGLRIRYYLISEYGTRGGRTHYHAIVFGDTGVDNHKKIIDTWRHGHVRLSPVTPRRIRYVAKYHALPPRTFNQAASRTFVLMSRKPGIGGQHRSEYDRSGVELVRDHSGGKLGLPRYYRLDRDNSATSEAQLESIYARVAKEKNRASYPQEVLAKEMRIFKQSLKKEY